VKLKRDGPSKALKYEEVGVRVVGKGNGGSWVGVFWMNPLLLGSINLGSVRGNSSGAGYCTLRRGDGQATEERRKSSVYQRGGEGGGMLSF